MPLISRRLRGEGAICCKILSIITIRIQFRDGAFTSLNKFNQLGESQCFWPANKHVYGLHLRLFAVKAFICASLTDISLFVSVIKTQCSNYNVLLFVRS
jgi:hypothetical protein